MAWRVFRLVENESRVMRQYNLRACLYEVSNTRTGSAHTLLAFRDSGCLSRVLGKRASRPSTQRKFQRKHGMSRASPADRASSSQTNRPVDRCHTSNFTRAASKAVKTEGFPSLTLNSAHMTFDVWHGFNSGEQNSCS